MVEMVPEDITKEEEEEMVLYYHVKMLDMCEHLKTPIQVHSTSTVYYKTLFTQKRVFQYEMRNLIAACVFLAMKVENIYVTAEILKSRLTFIDVTSLVQYEIEICNALNFNFHVPSPHLRLLGVFLMMKNRERIRIATEDSVQTQEIQEIDKILNWEKSVENLKNIMLSDKYTELNPHEVALAALTVQPSELLGFFMEETVEAVKKIKMSTIRRELPTKEQLRKIDEKIQLIQKRYGILQK